MVRAALGTLAALVSLSACSVASRSAAPERPPVTDNAAKSASVVTTVPVPAPTPAPAPVPTTAPPAPPAVAAAPQTASATASAAARAEVTTTEKSFGGYALHTNADGSVVRWNPCSVIRWRANLTLAPPGALHDLTIGFDQLAAATGMSFKYDGVTTMVPTAAWRSGSTDSGLIVVAWVPKAATDLLGDGASGEGGWYEEGSKIGTQPWKWQIVRGFVVIDPGATAGYLPDFADGVSIGALVLHELGHAAGLGHADDKTQIMWPVLTNSTTAHYSPGDLAGLSAIGRSAGCITG
jgi:hypothetical protein